MGAVAEQSEDGAGKLGCNALSVTFVDSSPRGRAKGLYRYSGANILQQEWRNASIPLDFSEKKNTMDAYCFP
jgi:hypothetical protein